MVFGCITKYIYVHRIASNFFYFFIFYIFYIFFLFKGFQYCYYEFFLQVQLKIHTYRNHYGRLLFYSFENHRFSDEVGQIGCIATCVDVILTLGITS